MNTINPEHSGLSTVQEIEVLELSQRERDLQTLAAIVAIHTFEADHPPTEQLNKDYVSEPVTPTNIIRGEE